MSSMGTCPSCNRQIKFSSKFCKYCGKTLKTCPECNGLNTAKDSFCGLCGADISKVKAPVAAKEISMEEKREKNDFTQRIEEREEKLRGETQQKLIVWPPVPQSRQYSPVKPHPYAAFQEEGIPYEPKKIAKYPYNRVRPLGFLGGPLPTSSVLSATLEAFGLALALIAGGVVIMGIGFAFFEYLVPAVIGGILGSALLLSAPFFGIYYVSSNWLYKTFQIKRPVRPRTIVWNYALSSLLFSFLALLLTPIFIQEIGPVGITLSVLGGVVYLMGLIIIPLKAFLADLVYVKAATIMRDKEEKEQKNEEEKVEVVDKKEDEVAKEEKSARKKKTNTKKK